MAKPVPTIRDDMSIREDAVPVVHGDRTIAVVTRHANLTGGRTPEPARADLPRPRRLAHADGRGRGVPVDVGADRACGAVRRGSATASSTSTPRGWCATRARTPSRPCTGWATSGTSSARCWPRSSPTCVSRSGANVDESLAVVATGRAAWRSEVETASATITMRAIPLVLGGVRTGAMVLLRDVSELRRREQELLTKDATIREIHHRVKNNLQTVAALLRLQARRVTDEAARASLEEAVRRVGTIALVHETLSQGFDETVDFDEIAVRGLRAVVEVATREHRVESTFTGSFGRMRAEDATALAMIVSELVQNAVEHGLRGPRRQGRRGRDPQTLDDGEEQLTVVITDDGVGLPAGFRPVARRAGDPDRHLARGGPQGPDPVGEQRAAAAPRVGVRRRGCGRSAGSGVSGRVSVRAAQPARRARALRRLSARRSSSDMPPHTPASWPDSMAHFRQVSTTSHRRQTALASSI